MFVAKTINGAYYVQNKTVKERQVLCNAVKQQPCKPLVLPGSGKFESTLQEWHLNLGHINKETLVNMLHQAHRKL